MLSEETLKLVRKIQLSTRRIINDVVAGQYRSHFRGQGMQFSEHRIYQPGDDVRRIDWKASARTREPLVKKYEEERELVVLLVVDVSGSEHFGSQSALKSEVVAQIAGMIASAAIHTGDQVGVILFSDQVEKIIPPKKGRNHMLRLIRDLLVFEAKSTGTKIETALLAANRLMKHKGIVFVVSDFADEGYSRSVQRLSRKNDVVLIRVSDPFENQLHDGGILRFLDPETGEEAFINTQTHSAREWIKKLGHARAEAIRNEIKGSKAEFLEISTDGNYGEAVVRFFMERNKGRVFR